MHRGLVMTARSAKVLAVLLATVAAVANVSAQGTPPDPAPPGRDRTSGGWIAVGRDEPLSTRLGHTYDRDFFALGVWRGWHLAGGGRWRAEYIAELLPVLVSSGMPIYAPEPDSGTPCDRGKCPDDDSWSPLRGTRSVYGLGVAPLGARVRVALLPGVALSLRGTAGLTWFTHPIPDPGERRLNALAELGAELELGCVRGLALGVGYRLQHISNAGTGPVNPGMDTRLLALGAASGCRGAPAR